MIEFQDFEVALSPKQLLEIMSRHDLKAEDIHGVYVFELDSFIQQFITQPNDKQSRVPLNQLKNSIYVMSHWPKQLNWPDFNVQINSLLTSWLDDYKSSADQEHMFLLASCLKLISPISTNQPDATADSRFKSLLMHLIARITHQFDQHRFEYSRNFDMNTDLPNRHLLLNMLKQRLSTSNERKSHLGIILIHLNIDLRNRSQSESISRKLHLAAAEVIMQHLDEDSTLFQLGTGELAVLVNNLNLSAQLNFTASQVLHAFEYALPLEKMTIILKPYLGCASTFNTASNTKSIMHCAAIALQHAIDNNRRLEVYDPITTSASANTPKLEEVVIQALQDNELEVYLQPIVSLFSRPSAKVSCNGAELLLRWKNHEWPGVSPVQIIEIIYRKGFGTFFIRWLINNACRHISELRARYQHDISLTVNLCAADLLDEDLAELIALSIKLWDIPADNLVIEMTESDLVLDEAKATQVIDSIVSLGCKLALDDFGTGYSSMARLRNMPIDMIKIDQSFIRNLSESWQDKKIVQSIVDLAHGLEKEIVAEGVEDIATLNILKEMQCEKIQGYYYAKPLPYDEFCSWLEHFKSDR